MNLPNVIGRGFFEKFQGLNTLARLGLDGLAAHRGSLGAGPAIAVVATTGGGDPEAAKSWATVARTFVTASSPARRGRGSGSSSPRTPTRRGHLTAVRRRLVAERHRLESVRVPKSHVALIRLSVLHNEEQRLPLGNRGPGCWLLSNDKPVLIDYL
jgi:hypothetical protein